MAANSFPIKGFFKKDNICKARRMSPGKLGVGGGREGYLYNTSKKQRDRKSLWCKECSEATTKGKEK